VCQSPPRPRIESNITTVMLNSHHVNTKSSPRRRVHEENQRDRPESIVVTTRVSSCNCCRWLDQSHFPELTEGASLFRASLIELALLGLLIIILVFSITLLRRYAPTPNSVEN